LINLFIIIQMDALLMYHKFDHMLQKSTLITCFRWLAWREKNGQTRQTNKWGIINK